MTASIRRLATAVPLLALLLATACPARAAGVAETVVHAFGPGDGGPPSSGLVQAADGLLYGVTGGTLADCGTIYRITRAGAHETVHAFDGAGGCEPIGELLPARDGFLYGTTNSGGPMSAGVLFRQATDGSFTVLDTFGGALGAGPTTGVMQARDGTIYGTTPFGGTFDGGTIFKVTAAGRIKALRALSQTQPRESPIYEPSSTLTEGPDGFLYGIATGNYGTLYRFSPAGGLALVHEFAPGPETAQYPLGRLLVGIDGALYGTTYFGGHQFPDDSEFGTIYRIGTDGAYTLIHRFTFTDGAFPRAGLVRDAAGSMYGTTTSGGHGYGTVFRTDTLGNVTVLHLFAGAPGDGATSQAPLLLARDHRLYGTTWQGGTFDDGSLFAGGTVFRVSRD